MEFPCPKCGTIRVRNWKKSNSKKAQKLRTTQCNDCRLKNMRSESFRKIVSESKLGKPRPDWVRKKLSQIKKGKYTGTENHFYGKSHTNESKDLQAKAALQKYANLYGYETIEQYEASKPDRDKYYRLVWKLTKRCDKTLIKNYDKLAEDNTAGQPGALHLDHIYPISEGYANNIPADLLADISNLQYIPWLDNQLKSNKIKKIPKHIQKYLDNRK